MNSLKRISVLHINNAAGVASILAKWHKKLYKWKTWVITRAVSDPFGVTTYGSVLSLRAKPFKYYSLFKAFRYLILHIHSADFFLPFFKKIYKNKLLVLHYHGSDIRNRWYERKQYWKIADVVLVSTPDLLDGAPPDVQYLPNPVDTDLFYPMPHLRREGTALYMIKHQKGEDLNWPKIIAKRLNLKLTIIDRTKMGLPYVELPKFLNQFEYYIDRNYIFSLSKTALEALACGLKVVRWDNQVLYGLPNEHTPEYVARKLCNIYSDAFDFQFTC